MRPAVHVVPRGRAAFVAAAGAAAALLVAGALVLAHEGHGALETKGASVAGDTVRLSPEARKAIGLKVADVEIATLEAVLRVNAEVFLPPDREAFASTRVDGRVVALLARPGQTVEAGAELARVESLELETLALDLIQASSELTFAKKELERLDALVKQGLAAAKDRLEVDAQARELEVRIDAARRRLLAVGISADEVDRALTEGKPVRTLAVRAPIGGLVTHADLEVGRFVETTQHLFHVADLREVWIAGFVPQDRAAAVEVGALVRASFAAYPGRTFAGKIDRVTPAVDPRTGARRVYAAFANDADIPLKPGLAGVLEIVTARAEDATAAPLSGVASDAGSTFAFVEESEGTYKRRELVLGIRANGLVEVKDGLFPGDRIVSDGKHQLAALFVVGVLRLSEAARKNLGVETEVVDLRPVEKVERGVGRVTVPTGREAAVSSRIHGKVRRVLKNVGEAVSPDEPVIEVESLEVEGLEIDLRRETLRLELARATLERLQKLAGEGIPAQREVLKAERELRAIENAVASLRRRLEALGVSPDDIERAATKGETSPVVVIRSPLPFPSLVRARAAIPGQVVRPGEALVEVAALSPLWVVGAIAQESVGAIRAEAPVRARIAALPERTIDGKLAFTTHTLDEVTRTLPVYAEIPNQDGTVLPGMRADLTVVLGAAEEVVAVPRPAVGSLGGRTFTIVEKGGGTFERIPVEVGRVDDRFAEVRKGLFPGDRVVVRGVEAVRAALASVR